MGSSKSSQKKRLSHIGSATVAARTRMAELCVAAVSGWLESRRPDNLVNPDLWPAEA